MRIQHNIMAMNAYRNYNTNTKSLSGNLEKLSSGYKINRAGDDAAGLAISEKMRAQITGLDAAQKNVKDGISLVKTAEGAMQEIQDMLNRMDYLATQSANGTYDNEVDRANLQKEVEALKTEINRIADSANFNGIKLLDGSQAKTDAKDAYTETVDVTGMDRILTSIIGKDEQPYEVNNVKTVFDSYASASKAATLEIDFSKLNFSIGYIGSEVATATSSLAGDADAFGSFTLTIGSFSVTITATDLNQDIATGVSVSSGTMAVDGSIAGADIAQAFMNRLNMDSIATASQSATQAYITLNDVKWKATISGSKLKLTQVNKPQTLDEATANFNVGITHTPGQGETFSVKMTGDLQDGTTPTAGVPVGTSRSAATVFKITADDIVDGATIKLGDATYTFAVGAESKYVNASADYVIDLTSMEVGDPDLLRTALTAFGSANQTVDFEDGEGNSETFNVTVTDNGIAVMRQTPPSAADEVYFNSLEKLARNFSLSYGVEHEAKAAQSGLVLQIGDTADSFNQMNVAIGDMHTDAMGTGTYTDENGNEVTVTKTIADITVANQADAAEAVQVIKNAINYVSSIRGDLGAIQNRLEHTGNNLSVMAENIQDAESTIRDTDVANEMMSYVKNNILVQSAQAMLAQANQLPQGVLQLLG